MVVVREAVAGDWQALRDIRLEALRTAPTAFGTSYEEEARRGDEHWHNRIARGGTFLAYLPAAPAAPEAPAAPATPEAPEAPDVPDVPAASDPVGLIGGYPEDSHTVELISTYVRPQGRGRGVGEALVAAVIGWARERNAATVRLWVTETNTHAEALYERCGFALTGERQPVPFNPGLDEVAMSRTLP